MIVYGDRQRTCSLEAALTALRLQLSRARSSQHAQQRRGLLASLMIDVGSLAQALLDQEFEARGLDELTASSVACAHACSVAARAWLAQTQLDSHLCELDQALQALEGSTAAGELCLRDPEGFAFYALYPELYVHAAQSDQTLRGREVQIIGIRSIGCALSGLLAVTLGSARVPLTFRPTGHPFARELRVGPKLEAVLLHQAEQCVYAVVDEGPGLSGSSFDAVARFLCARGVRREQLVFFPSHAGEPGAQASDEVRSRYRSTRRCVSSFEDFFDGRSAERSLSHWFADTVGPATEDVRDLSAGRWRALLYARPADYPPSYARDERRKYWLRTAQGEFLMKFVGLGGRAPELLERARVLSQEQLTPELIDARHGFALTRFVRAATPLPQAAVEREQLVRQLSHYLTFRVRRFSVRSDYGAQPAALLRLLKHNAGELLGRARVEELARLDAQLPRLQQTLRPTATDNKREPFEWLVTEDGRLLKCDAVDHHAGHDCIGCQDPAWDLAGALIEHGLSNAELESLCAALWDGARYRLSDQKLRFYQLAYLAFRAGRAHYGELAQRGWADDDANRIRDERLRYVSELESRL